ncbi:uncharacterized protein L203_100311 [Cryptococcus depauperatus CBS 7841]|uniref:Uncharacterized protein n=1 Tax=Cryptococcus depauperatus CBS 7841 TaxID=1295531 RepID=A0A1E3IZM3_9TREE|nr:hypothetical protein L203_00030 [Cryptococcus depauperatus CBS 7841]
MDSFTFPPLAALFLTHFDDVKGQSVLYYSSLPDLSAENIEHTTLPSGLHIVEEDLVIFKHNGLNGVGLFRNKLRQEGDRGGRGRGRHMGVVGVVLVDADASDLFILKSSLIQLYDQLEQQSSPFASPSEEPSPTKKVMDAVWERYRGYHTKLEGKKEGTEITRTQRLITEKGNVPAEHPVSFMPSLLGSLGPSIVPVYKAALSGQRILLYSPPPLLPLAALAWNIWASSLPPEEAEGGNGIEVSELLGNVGLMDMESLKVRKGGWVATTSDMIYKSHPAVYDLFIDLSSTPLTTTPHPCPSTLSTPSPIITSSATSPPSTMTYSLAGLPLYRSLLLLASSPPSVHAGVNKEGGWWLLVYEVLERIWRVCVGVCGFAVGHGNVEGELRLEDGAEDARLLSSAREEDLLDLLSEAASEENTTLNVTSEDELARQGRLILRQLFHNTHHFYVHLLSVLASRPKEQQSIGQLNDAEVKELTSLWDGKLEVVFWREITRRWGVLFDP